MFISLIVPAYNVSGFILRCLASLVNQDFDKTLYEIIIVNDGSTDNTLAIINDFITNNPDYNIMLIDKKNGGLSSARNAGFVSSKGDYVWFIDSDDYLQEDSLLNIKDTIGKYNQLDVLAFNMDYVYDDGTNAFNPRRLSPFTYLSGSELFLSDYRYPYSGVQFSIYRRRYLLENNLNFREGIFFEDILYTTKLLSSDPICVYDDSIYYHYFIRQGSITNSKASIKKCRDMLCVSDDLYNLLKLSNKYNAKVLYDQIIRILATLYRYHLKGLSLKDKLCVIKEVSYRGYWAQSLFEIRKYKYIPYLVLTVVSKPLKYIV